MRSGNKHACAQGAGRVRRGQGCCLPVIRSILWCVQHDGQQKNDKKGQANTAKMWAETKPKKLRVDRNEVVGLRWIWICAWCCEVIWCVWYRKIYHDTSCHYVPYHAISQDTAYRDILSYLHPEFLGLIWRYRIPSIYFSIPITKFLPVRCTRFGAPRKYKKRLLNLAIELQKQWYLLECVSYKKLQGFVCGYIDRSCVTGSRLCNMFVWRGLFVPVNPALCVSPERVWRVFFRHLALSVALTRTTTTNCNYDISQPFSQPLNPFTPSRSMYAGNGRHARGAPCISIQTYFASQQPVTSRRLPSVPTALHTEAAIRWLYINMCVCTDMLARPRESRSRI